MIVETPYNYLMTRDAERYKQWLDMGARAIPSCDVCASVDCPNARPEMYDMPACEEFKVIK
jgi:hypothetical protein